MATVITSECINCGACEPECPNTAIYQGGMEWEFNGQTHAPLANDIFYIVPEKCARGCDACVGTCTVEAISTDKKRRIKVIDQTKCVKCGMCVTACPPQYHAVIRLSPPSLVPQPAEK